MDQGTNDNICRICLNVQDTLFSLYRKQQGTSPYEKLISRTKLAIQLNDSGPPSICPQCLIDLDTTVSFLDKCERSNKLLGERLARGLNKELSGFKECSNEVEYETKLVKEEIRSLIEEVKEVKFSEVILREEKCPECGSRRRCKHWAPPTVHTCQYCNKTFNKKYNYQLHVKRHLGENDFSCSICGAQQLTRWAAGNHCRPRPRQPCPVDGCGKSFTTTTNLHIHIRKHSGEKPFECDDCGKTFISKNILNNHIRTHTGVKPYMCQICGKQFTTNKLSSHMACHGGGGAERAGGGRAVGAGGAGGGQARLACAPPCTRVFVSARALRSHARSHAPERPYACALCHTTYKFKQSLNYHVKNTHGVNAKSAVQADPSPVTSSSTTNIHYEVVDKIFLTDKKIHSAMSFNNTPIPT